MAKRLSLNSAAFKRYRGLIQSIVWFLLLVIAVLAFNIYTSFLIERNAVQVAAAQQLRGLTQTITRDLYDLKLSQGEDLRSPHIQATQRRLSTGKQQFEATLLAFQQGGSIPLPKATACTSAHWGLHTPSHWPPLTTNGNC